MRPLRPALLLALAALTVGCGGGPSYKAKFAPFTIDSTDFALPSGLRVVFQEDHTRPTVTVVSVVDVGSQGDPQGKEGIAHLVEHMCFRARHDGKTQVMDVIKGIGGAFNAYTAAERTVYITTAPKDALAGLLRIEALRMLDPVANIEDRILDIEREVVRNELRVRTETNIGNRIFQELESLLYPADHPRHRTGIGTHETLSSIGMDDVRAFTEAHYRPAKTTIVISGDFDRQQAGLLLQQAFPPALMTADGQPLPPGKKLELTQPKPRVVGDQPAVPEPTEALRRITGPVEEPTIVVGWLVPSAWRGKGTVMETAALFLGGYLGYTLRPRTGDVQSLTTGVGCGVDPGIDASLFYCVIGIAPGDIDLDDMLDKARSAPALMWQWGDSRAEFDRARAALVGRTLSELAYEQRVERVALHTHYLGRVDAYRAAFEDLEQLDVEDQRDFAYEHLTRDRMAALIVEPEEKKAGQGPAFDADATWSGAVFEGDTRLDAIYARMQPADIARAAVSPLGDDIERFELPNGLPVIIVRHPGAPLVRVSLMTHGGYQSTDPMGLVWWMRSRDDAPEATRFTGRRSRWSAEGYAIEFIEAPSPNLPDALAVMDIGVRTRRALDPGLRRGRAIAFQKAIEARRRERDPAYAVQEAATRALYREHPLGRVTLDGPAIEALTQADFQRHLEAHLAPANATLMVIGDIDLAEARAAVEARFGSWRAEAPGQRVVGLPPAPKPPEQRTVIFRARPEATQVALTLSCLVDGAPERSATRAVLSSALRDDLWYSLRENTGSSYSPSAYTDTAANGNAGLYIRATVQTDQAIRALSAILDRLGALGRGELKAAALRKAQWSVARRTRLQGRTPGELTSMLARMLRDGLDLDALRAYPQALAAVDPASVGEVLEPCAGHEVIGVVGPPSLAEALADFGAVQILDAAQ